MQRTKHRHPLSFGKDPVHEVAMITKQRTSHARQRSITNLQPKRVVVGHLFQHLLSDQLSAKALLTCSGQMARTKPKHVRLAAVFACGGRIPQLSACLTLKRTMKQLSTR